MLHEMSNRKGFFPGSHEPNSTAEPLATISAMAIFDGVVWNFEWVSKGGMETNMPSAIIRLTLCERRLVVKNQSFQNATRRREKGLAKRTELYLAVTGPLQDGSLREGPSYAPPRQWRMLKVLLNRFS